MKTVKLLFITLFLVTGCANRLSLEPLPYAHPANPDAAEGMMPKASEALTPSTDADPSAKSEPMQRMKCGAGMKHGGMKHGQ